MKLSDSQKFFITVFCMITAVGFIAPWIHVLVIMVGKYYKWVVMICGQ